MKRLILAGLALLIAGSAAHAQAVFRPITSYKISLPAATAVTASRAVQANVQFARIICSATCHVAFPASPIQVSLTAPVMLPAGIETYTRVTPGTFGLAIREGAAGTVFITEMN